MKILMIWDGDYPWDVRVEKVCRTLIENGDQVHLVCRNSKGLNRHESINGLNIRRVFSLPPSWKFWNSILTFPAFFSPLWLHEINNAIKETNPEVIIVRDLPMAIAAIILAKRWGIPVILDMAECYPEMLRCIWEFEDFRPQNILVRNPYLADIVERIVVRNMDMVWVMVEESAERLRRMGVHSGRIRIVSNTPSIKSHDEHEAVIPVSDRSVRQSDRVEIVYIGLLNPSRGLRTVIDAAKILKDRGRLFRVTIAGDGKDSARLKQRSESLGVSEYVRFLGWVDHESIDNIISTSDIGIVPHYRCSHWDNTIPNKLFDYMKSGIPVVVSDARPTARIVQETGCGVVYKNQDPQDLADKIEALFDPNERKRMGVNGRSSIEQKYCWQQDSETLLRSLGELRARDAG